MNFPNIKADALIPARIEHAMLMLNEHNIPAATKWAATFGPALNTDPDPWIEHEYLAMARVMIAQNESQRIIPALEALRKDATKSGRNGSQIELCVVLASAYKACGDDSLARDRSIEALRLAEQNEYIRLFIDGGEPILTLLNDIHQSLKRNRIAVSRDYVERLLGAARGQTAVNAKPSQTPVANLTLVEPLSDREMEIILLISAGHSNQEIADKSFVALSTVKWHINNIYGKLQVTSRTQAIVRAQQLKLV